MLKFSRSMLTALILMAFFYKKVYSYNQLEHESENSNWKGQQKPEMMSVHDFVNLLNVDDAIGDDTFGGGGHYHRDGWIKIRPGQHRSKRSINELDDVSNEIITDELMNAPISQLDMDKIQRSPWMKYLLMRRLNYLQEKRNREFNPRLGRNVDDCVEYQRSRPPFAPRLGKKSRYFTPRLGREICSDFVAKQ